MIFVALAGCSGDGVGDVVTLTDDNVYTFSETPISGLMRVAPGDGCVDWSAVTRTARGDAYTGDPDTELDATVFRATPAEVVTGRIADDAVLDFHSTHGLRRRTSVCLDELLPPATFAADTTWHLLIDTPRRDGDSMPVLSVLVEVTEGADADLVLVDGLTTLDFFVDVPGVATAPADRADLVVDWSAVTRSGQQGDMTDAWKESVDRLIVARFDTRDADEFVQSLDGRLTAAAERYERRLDGPSATVSLEGLVDADGGQFTGFTTDGFWVVGATCEDCWIEPPAVLAVLDVEAR